MDNRARRRRASCGAATRPGSSLASCSDRWARPPRWLITRAGPSAELRGRRKKRAQRPVTVTFLRAGAAAFVAIMRSLMFRAESRVGSRRAQLAAHHRGRVRGGKGGGPLPSRVNCLRVAAFVASAAIVVGAGPARAADERAIVFDFTPTERSQIALWIEAA